VPSNTEATIGLADGYVAKGDTPAALAALDAHPALRSADGTCDASDAQAVQLWFTKAQLLHSLAQWDPFVRIAHGLLTAHVQATAALARRRQRAPQAKAAAGASGGDDTAQHDDMAEGAPDDGDADGVLPEARADGSTGAEVRAGGACSSSETLPGVEVGRSVVVDVLTEEGECAALLSHSDPFCASPPAARAARPSAPARRLRQRVRAVAQSLWLPQGPKAPTSAARNRERGCGPTQGCARSS
jgi:hypothetical protein